MRVLVLEDNLIWSERLRLGLEALDHECVVAATPSSAEAALGPGGQGTRTAIVNLGSRAFPAAEWIARLKSDGFKIVAHAGHKERPLLLVGTDSGADLVVTNSELTHKLGEVLERLSS